MTELLEALNDIIKSGVELSTIIVVIVAILKVYEGRQRRKIDEEIRNDIKAIKGGLGICDAVTLTAVSRDTPMRRGAWSLLRSIMSTIARCAGKFTTWRLRMMNSSINWVTLVVALLGAAKIVLQAFGIDVIDDEMIDKASNAVAAIVTVVGVIISHRKKGDEINALISASIERTN